MTVTSTPGEWTAANRSIQQAFIVQLVYHMLMPSSVSGSESGDLGRSRVVHSHRTCQSQVRNTASTKYIFTRLFLIYRTFITSFPFLCLPPQVALPVALDLVHRREISFCQRVLKSERRHTKHVSIKIVENNYKKY